MGSINFSLPFSLEYAITATSALSASHQRRFFISIRGGNTNLFESVKDTITTRIAAQQYGIQVNRHGMCACPFHNDKNPSMKVDRRFHCFGCQADGDVIDFTARLFHLTPKDAALKLASDFGISYDKSIPAKRNTPVVSEAERLKHQLDFCYSELCDYRNQLMQWEEQYAPKNPDEDLHPLFLEAVSQLDQVEYQLDVLLSGSDSEKIAVLNEYMKTKKEKEALLMKPIVKTPLYKESAVYAREHGELEQFRNSHWTNNACKTDIEEIISRNFDGMHLEGDCAKDVLALYGPERVQMILAATVQMKAWDGRFSKSNKDWAFTIPMPNSVIEGDRDRRLEYEVSTHPAVLDGFISLVRKEIRELEHPSLRETLKKAEAELPKPSPNRKPKETEMAR